MISVETALEQRFPGLSKRRPKLGKTLTAFLRYLLHESEFRHFEQKYPHLQGFDFVEQVLEYFDFDYRAFDRECRRIPHQGRVVVVANHPIGSLDGLALLKLIGSVRRDVKVIANDLLYQLPPLRSLLLPVDNINGRTPAENVRDIHRFLQDDGAVVVFPAGEVSRMGPAGIRDGKWNAGFLRFAERAQAPIVPMHLDGRNSLFFYALSMLAKPISSLWLVREMFKQANNHIDVRIGKPIYPHQWQGLGRPSKELARQLKRQVYRLGRGKTMHRFEAELEAIAHPEERRRLRTEIHQCQLLGSTSDNLSIYLCRYRADSTIMREVARLRELTFRTVQEGTGYCRDWDRYDLYYDHLLLWDDDALEIAGAYRMMASSQCVDEQGEITGLYSQTLFDLNPGFVPIARQGLELGRSFVQPRYQGKRSLDYLWYGIGAYLNLHPEIRYLFGPVSISHSYPEKAKQLLVRFYSDWFSDGDGLATALQPFGEVFSSTPSAGKQMPDVSSDAYGTAWKTLRAELAELGVKVPVLYKQYAEVCEPGGARFCDFNVDPQFSNCIDGFMVVELERVKTKKRLRYLGQP
ncbi:lysophospholipid acyltransferase family protein [Aestuariirhabdus sp. Z084]|uniref:GNAT family N-acyltransferase n=1 Tax=Aestuariirhabdus haliotis TaxID=2918751 RepID=UPI00201B3CCF|nr:GNAT family N-acyltransferase [Aestuariirhabdus haliotis]MCL6415744.1 lysophospholipid acyltransferase family protein [Aestuariirhabdus haliotis]MCL6419661.1 lysophospholipid acyltransferase family protein [Aestuariirhabdus haliotis]